MISNNLHIIRSNHNDSRLLSYLTNLMSWSDYFSLPDDPYKQLYGLPEVFNGIHRKDDCGGVIILTQNCNCSQCMMYVKNKMYNRIVYTGKCNRCKKYWCSLFNLGKHCTFHRN